MNTQAAYEKRLSLVASGLSTDLVDRLLRCGYSLGALKSRTGDLRRNGFDADEIRIIREAVSRKAIPAATVRRLVQECDWRCCVCWDYKKLGPVLIHHIKEHSKTRDDRYENLVLLCPDHHALAHTHSEIARQPCPPELLIQKKREFSEAVRSFIAGHRPAPGCELHGGAEIPSLAPALPRLFVGRAQMICDVIDLLRTEQSLALYGMPGSGKTSVAQRCALDLTPEFAGGIFWADLGEDSGSVTATLRKWASSLRIDISSDETQEELCSRVQVALGSQQRFLGHVLVVVDDVRLEWMEGVRVLRRMIPSGARTLFTTRDLSLAQSLDARPFRVDVMEEDEGISLLRAHAGRTLEGTEDSRLAVVLRIVGNLPLAIELIGKRLSRLQAKPGDQLAATQHELEHQPLAALELRGHPGVSATFAITYNELTESEQQLFRWLGACAGGVLRSATLASMLKIASEAVEKMMDELVDRSLLRWGDSSGLYRLHPLLYEYARDLLAHERGGIEQLAVWRKHLAAHHAIAKAHSGETPGNFSVLDGYLTELLLCVQRGIDMGEHALVVEIAWLLWTESDFLRLRGHFREAKQILEHAVTSARITGSTDMLGLFLGGLGVVCNILGLVSEAAEYYHSALEATEQAGNVDDQAAHLGNLGLLHLQRGESELAFDAFNRAVRLAESSGNLTFVADQFAHLGSLFRRFDPSRSRRYYADALALAHDLRYRKLEGSVISNLGLLDFDAGDLASAEDRISRGLAIAIEIGDRRGEANRRGHLGNIYLQRGKLQLAEERFQEAADMCRQIGDVFLEASWVGSKGNVLLQKGSPALAIPLFEHAIILARQAESDELQGRFTLNLAISYRELKNILKARMYGAAALKLFSAAGSPLIAVARQLLNELGAR